MSICTQKVAQVISCEIYEGPHFSINYVSYLQKVEKLNYLK